ncbi:MAG: tRNA pseudouridine(38-40) synthase TruA [Desulfuromonadales bacterium]|nr:tRNA pseudouridine(38-40) synthase TruA [Desulfuromonadales bacterium]
MRTILLIIEYDGTAYSGWQIQPNGLAVQQVVEEALARVVGVPVRLHSAGRTDAGVHARAMPAHLQTDRSLPLAAFREGVNRFLPADVAVKEVREMPADFHARFAARGKWYRYTLYRGAIRSPLVARCSWHLPGQLDLVAMRQAAQLLVGEHDFRAFRSSACSAQGTVRRLTAVEIDAAGELLQIDVHGSGFLKNMVRMLVGTLVEIGRGKRPVADIPRLLAGDSPLRCGVTAPPQGLCLMEVRY